jgi:hypothetical protein
MTLHGILRCSCVVKLFHLKKSRLIELLTIASHLNHFWFENFPLATKKVSRLACLLRCILTRSLKLEKSLRVMRETLFHSRLSCVMLAPDKVWDAP